MRLPSGEGFEHVHKTSGFERVELVNREGNACNEPMFRREPDA